MMLKGIMRFLAKAVSLQRKKLTFFPSITQIKNRHELSEEELQFYLEKIAKTEIEAFLRCNGVFSIEDWFSLSQKEAELVKEVAAKIKLDDSLQLARIVGNNELADTVEDKISGRVDRIWKKAVEKEMKVLGVK